MNVALFGGTFDPIHRGHLAVAKAAQREYGIKQVLFVPSATPPHKHPLTPYIHRYAMVALAAIPSFHYLLSSERAEFFECRRRLEVRAADGDAHREEHPRDRAHADPAYADEMDFPIEMHPCRHYWPERFAPLVATTIGTAFASPVPMRRMSMRSTMSASARGRASPLAASRMAASFDGSIASTSFQ